MTTEPPAPPRLADALVADRLRSRSAGSSSTTRCGSAGANPADAAWPSLGIGAVVGPRGLRPGPAGRAPPGRRRAAAAARAGRDPRAVRARRRPAPTAGRWPGPRSACSPPSRWSWGVYLAVDWLRTDSGDRATTTIILAAWNVLVGLWLGRRGACACAAARPTASSRSILGCGLTAVLAGVGLLARAGRDGPGRPDHRSPAWPASCAASPPGGCRAGAACRSRRDRASRSSPCSRSSCRSPSEVTGGAAGLPALRGRSSRTAPSRPRAPAPAAAPAYAGGGATPPEAVAAALARVGGRGRGRRRARAAAVRGRPAARRPRPAVAITSDRRDGFYLWWVFVRDGGRRPRRTCCGSCSGR